jgi:hypothetical protein
MMFLIFGAIIIVLSFFIVVLFSFAVLGIEPMASWMPSKHSTACYMLRSFVFIFLLYPCYYIFQFLWVDFELVIFLPAHPGSQA